ncbi:hypothetical protein HPB47_000643 [Ixodes persulcatus]|uniref:Uncharacterized protein n=1 Tax=Ixodes persulcatus TaxID=34615 RepID=A0AC60PR83_IXOPE|nr:hypothetical protein HPB47_000643 [Ixodes persulcatus]
MAGVPSGEYVRESDHLQRIPELTVGPNIRAARNQHYDFSQLPPAMLAQGDGDRPNLKEPDIEPMQQYSDVGFRLASILIENLVAHPCIVLRRQCQGLITLWKGAPSMFVVRGLAMVTETVLSECTPLPREVTSRSSLQQIAQHVALKSLVEVVQCDVASEKPGVLDCLREGLGRMCRWGAPSRGRMLPFWKLVGPTVAHGVLHHLLSSLVRSVATWLLELRSRQQRRHIGDRMGAIPRTVELSENYFHDLLAAFAGNLVADVVLFPLETVVHRLYLQGTRTIVDNLDTGSSVTAVISQYRGPVDCFQSIVAEEGAAGLYKGFGALVLQYALHCCAAQGHQGAVPGTLFGPPSPAAADVNTGRVRAQGGFKDVPSCLLRTTRFRAVCLRRRRTTY